MSWRPGGANISWRWIIRGTCLGLLGLCVGLWGLSYSYWIDVGHMGSRHFQRVVIEAGRLHTVWLTPNPGSRNIAPGWIGAWQAAPRPFMLHLVDGFALEVAAGDSWWTDLQVSIPFWSPTVMLALVLLLAWRKTGRGGTARGFPVEPLGSRRAGG